MGLAFKNICAVIINPTGHCSEQPAQIDSAPDGNDSLVHIREDWFTKRMERQCTIKSGYVKRGYVVKHGNGMKHACICYYINLCDIGENMIYNPVVPKERALPLKKILKMLEQ